MSDEPSPYLFDPVIEYAVVFYSATKPKFYHRIGQHIDHECLSNGPGGFEGNGEPRDAMKAVHEAARLNNDKSPGHIRAVTQVVRDMRENGRITVDHQIRVCGWLLDTPDMPSEEVVANMVIPILKRRIQDEAVNRHFEAYQHRADISPIITMLSKAERIGEDDNGEEGDLDDFEAGLSVITQLGAVSRLPTPIVELNELLGGGLPRGQYGLIAAESGVGKSTYLTSQICVALRKGLRCALISNELGLPFQYARLYANLCGAPFGEVLNGDHRLVRERMPLVREKYDFGDFKMKYLSEGHTLEDVREFLDEKEQEMGEAFDVVAVDYPDRMSPGSTRGDGEYHAQKVITGGFRDLAESRQYWVWGATQVQERDEVKIIKGRHLSDSMWKKRLIHVGISLNERDDGQTIAYYVFKNTTGVSDVITTAIPHDKHLARIAPVVGGPMGLSLLATQHGMAHAAQFGKHADHKGRVRANCPFCIDRKHSADRGQSFVYYRGSGFYKCFRCGIKSRDDSIEHTEFVPTERAAFKWVGGPPEFIPLWGDYPEPLQPAVDYLERRGIDSAIRSKAYIGACLQGRYANRIVIPHLDPDGSWWGWSARLWRKIPGARNYDYPPDMARDKLYNEHAIEVETDRPVMVVEGVLDSLLYLPHAVACLGQPTRAHLDILTRSKRPIALCLDADRWEVSKAWHMMLAHKGLRVGWVRLPDGTDPNEVDASRLRDAADKCIGGKITCSTK